MSTLSQEPYWLDAADLGPENPFPPIVRPNDILTKIAVDPSVSEEDRKYFGWGMPRSILPYRMQDGYNRVRRPKVFSSVVLENEHLRAVFLPSLGGRLWSLVSKDSGRELLARNPAFQPCNLAIRNAWLSGGVEWNFGWQGHWPLTCSPLFAARHTLPDGTPALRMWEWERVRRMPVQIDAWLPDGSRGLFVRVSLRNPSRETRPVYWWSNIAVEQHDDTRVLVSADSTLIFNYEKRIHLQTGLPSYGEEELTRPARGRIARDCFFRVPDEEAHPWICSQDTRGHGLFQTSTSLLRGRKLFRWGVSQGGENWQRQLCSPDYIEIQAGLARTQSHHLPMPGGAVWSWVEAYGEISADARATQGGDWGAARAAAAAAIRAAVPPEALDEALDASSSWADRPEADRIATGSGWGALERLRLEAGGEPADAVGGCLFPDDSIGPEEREWRDLLHGGVLPARNPWEEPGAFEGEEWLPVLEESLSRPGGRNWRSLYHCGVMRWQRGEEEAAIKAWRASCDERENAWARHALGSALAIRGRGDEAVANLCEALRLLPGSDRLLLLLVNTLLEQGKGMEALAVIDAAPEALQTFKRIRLARVRALIALGRMEEALQALGPDVMPDDIREGEKSLTNLWFEAQAFLRAKSTGRELDDDFRAEIRRTLVPPREINFLMS